MPFFRSDLTLETAEQLGIAGKNAKRQDGVRVMESLLEGYGVTAITVSSIFQPPNSPLIAPPMAAATLIILLQIFSIVHLPFQINHSSVFSIPVLAGSHR